MNGAFMINPGCFNKAIVLAMQLAYKNGKSAGDGMAEELNEVARRHPEWVEFLGNTEADADKITGDLREEGMKVLNIEEEKRKKDK
jgi:hypothetical protein